MTSIIVSIDQTSAYMTVDGLQILEVYPLLYLPS